MSCIWQGRRAGRWRARGRQDSRDRRRVHAPRPQVRRKAGRPRRGCESCRTRASSACKRTMRQAVTQCRTHQRLDIPDGRIFSVLMACPCT